MATRADFYIGKGPDAEWLGSIAMDGYPDGVPKRIIEIDNEKDYRQKVSEILDRDDGTKPEMGWPWPWNNSNTTDFAYTFDNGKIWLASFGHGWYIATEYDEERDTEPNESIDDIDWPDMTERKNVAAAGTARSGTILIKF